LEKKSKDCNTINTKLTLIDSLTHIVLGACIGEAMLGKKLGKRAMFIGALAQSIPDVDFLASLWNDTASNLLAHRGFTHSLLFDLLATMLFGLLAQHYHRTHRIGYKKWNLFFFLQITIHLFLDLFNNYGVGLLEPFSHQRFSFNVLFVADPFFSIWPAISFVALLALKSHVRKRTFWWRLSLVTCSVYLVYCSFNKMKITTEVGRILDKEKISYCDYFTTPTPLNNWLWYVAAKSDSGFYIGFRSVFDHKKSVNLTYFPQNYYLLQSVSNHEELQRLIRFSQGYYTVEKWGDTLIFNDLRFGQIIGWHDPKEKFVFHFYLQHADADNNLVVQRGRFAKWNKKTIKSLLKKIAGG
jgi:inner membrane protein